MRRWKSCGQHLTPDKGKRETVPDLCYDGALRKRQNVWSNSCYSPWQSRKEQLYLLLLMPSYAIYKECTQWACRIYYEYPLNGLKAEQLLWVLSKRNVAKDSQKTNGRTSADKTPNVCTRGAPLWWKPCTGHRANTTVGDAQCYHVDQRELFVFKQIACSDYVH